VHVRFARADLSLATSRAWARMPRHHLLFCH